VGTEARYEYTLIGPPVNEAARLTDVAKGRTVKVLASVETVRRAASEAARWHDVGTAALRGRAAPTAIYEPAAGEPAVAGGSGSSGEETRR
jgi:adenylate cyclase